MLSRITELRALTRALASRITAGDSYIDIPPSGIGNVVRLGDPARRDGTARGAIATYRTPRATRAIHDGRRVFGGVVELRVRAQPALAQLHHFAPEKTGSVLPSKALLVRQSAGSLPRPFRFRPLADLANEIEWAKNRRLTPPTYLEGLGEHEPPIPPDLMVGVFSGYERRKEAQGLLDFEDLLELAVRLYDEDEPARETFRAGILQSSREREIILERSVRSQIIRAFVPVMVNHVLRQEAQDPNVARSFRLQ